MDYELYIEKAPVERASFYLFNTGGKSKKMWVKLRKKLNFSNVQISLISVHDFDSHFNIFCPIDPKNNTWLYLHLTYYLTILIYSSKRCKRCKVQK